MRVIARATNRDPQERRWRYVLPEQWRMGAITGTGIWTEIVRDAWGGALIGLDLIRETRRPRFRSYQRRLALLHIPSGTGGQPTVVLETPLSGFIEQSMCPSPDPTGQASAPAEDDSQHPRALSDAEAARLNACVDDFYYRTQFTLPESHQPSGQPPDLIVATVATTLPGRRPRTPPGTLREPIVRTEDDIVRDPACTFTRTYYFDAAQGRYVPDAPLPACRDYLEP